MIKQIYQYLTSSLGFSKTESKGTLVLFIIIISTLITAEVVIKQLRDEKNLERKNPELNDWVLTVNSSLERNVSEKNEAKNYSYNKSATKSLNNSNYATSKRSIHQSKISNSNPDENTEIKHKKESLILDLNKVEPNQLQAINGIGPTFSNRIVKYRSVLGGFHDMDQLEEVYGLEASVIEKIKKQFSIQSKVSPITINSDSLKILARHPYISYDLAKIILAYRAENGDIRAIDDLKKIKAINNETLHKLKPYITN